MKKIAVGDLGEFWYGDYKEPFVQLEGGVSGHPQGVVLKADDGKLLCAYCGKTFDNLGKHVGVHGLSAQTYKEEVGLLQKSALVSEEGRRLRIRNGLKRLADDPGLSRVAARIKRRTGVPRGKLKGAPEKQNKTGSCYAQLIAVGRQMKRDRGQVTMKQLIKLGITQHVIESRFGSLSTFQRLVGLPITWRGRSDAELINALQNVAAELGRSPNDSDLRRLGAPTSMTYRRRFGSYQNALSRAGLAPSRFIPSLASDAEILEAYAVTGDLNKTMRLTHRGHRVRQVLHRYGIPVYFGFVSPELRHDARRLSAEIARRLEGDTLSVLHKEKAA